MSLQDEIDRLERETKTKPCDDLQKKSSRGVAAKVKEATWGGVTVDHYNGESEDEEFEAVWAEFMAECDARNNKDITMSGPDGFRIIDKPVENKKDKLKGIVNGDDWEAPHLCKEGSTPLRGTRGLMWVICKVCGTEMGEF